MEIPEAATAFAALGNERRLHVLRLLVQAGPNGVAAGEIARQLDTLQNTLSSSLSVLSHAGLVTSRREGRSIIYSAAYPRINSLIEFLVSDCCGGDPSLCGEAFFAVGKPAKASNCC